MTARPWSVHQLHGQALGLHGRVPADPPRRELWVCSVAGPAVVLGSTQPEDDVDRSLADDRGVAVVRRRSGGGAVLLEPGAVVWVDAVVPRGDPLWDDDVGRAFVWFGRVWAQVLVALGLPADAVAVHEGPLVSSAASPVLCFAGLGPGEVTVGGAKAVGVSQRRTRSTVRLQASLPLIWDAGLHADLLGPGLRRVAAGSDPADVVSAVRVHRWATVPDAATVVDAVLANLPEG